jgi:hypothetical protein
MGIRKSVGKNKKSKRPAAAAAVGREDVLRKGAAPPAKRPRARR